MNIALAIYLTNVLGSLKGALLIISIFGWLASFAIGIVCLAIKSSDYAGNEGIKNATRIYPTAKKCFIWMTIVFVLTVFFPCKNVAYQMLIADKAQYYGDALSGKYGTRIEKIVNMELDKIEKNLTEELHDEKK